MVYTVTEEQRRAYAQDGVVCLRNVIPAETCSVLLEKGEHFLDYGSTPGFRKADVRDKGGRYRTASMMWRTEEAFKNFALESELPAVASQLMCTKNIRLFYDQIFLVEPETGMSTSWHNDQPFWPLQGNDIISLWVALTEVTEENSPLEYVAGSHRGKIYRPDNYAVDYTSDADLEVCPDFSDPAIRDSVKILSWTLNPGDVLAHHPLAVHGAPPSVSKVSRRCGLSVRYLGDDVIYDPQPYSVLPLKLDVEIGKFPEDDLQLPKAEVV